MSEGDMLNSPASILLSMHPQLIEESPTQVKSVEIIPFISVCPLTFFLLPTPLLYVLMVLVHGGIHVR